MKPGIKILYQTREVQPEDAMFVTLPLAPEFVSSLMLDACLYQLGWLQDKARSHVNGPVSLELVTTVQVGEHFPLAYRLTFRVDPL